MLKICCFVALRLWLYIVDINWLCKTKWFIIRSYTSKVESTHDYVKLHKRFTFFTNDRCGCPSLFCKCSIDKSALAKCFSALHVDQTKRILFVISLFIFGACSNIIDGNFFVLAHRNNFHQTQDTILLFQWRYKSPSLRRASGNYAHQHFQFSRCCRLCLPSRTDRQTYTERIWFINIDGYVTFVDNSLRRRIPQPS